MKSSAAKNAQPLSLKVTLNEIRPAIWRRLLVADSMRLDELHRAIQAAMGWENCHMHSFTIAGEQYGVRNPELDMADETRKTLRTVVAAGINRFVYTYDFGDDWQHAVLIEKKVPAVDVASLPLCAAGKRACPPEDCGGPWGYEELCAILADPAHPEHADRREWLGNRLESDAFDLEAANGALAAMFGRRSSAR